MGTFFMLVHAKCNSPEPQLAALHNPKDQNSRCHCFWGYGHDTPPSFSSWSMALWQPRLWSQRSNRRVVPLCGRSQRCGAHSTTAASRPTKLPAAWQSRHNFGRNTVGIQRNVDSFKKKRMAVWNVPNVICFAMNLPMLPDHLWTALDVRKATGNTRVLPLTDSLRAVVLLGGGQWTLEPKSSPCGDPLCRG